MTKTHSHHRQSLPTKKELVTTQSMLFKVRDRVSILASSRLDESSEKNNTTRVTDRSEVGDVEK